MGIEKVVRCDSCKCVVEENQGFVVLGNIHVVQPKANISNDDFDCVGGGLVGNSIEDGLVVRAFYYCKPCMGEILGFTSNARTSDFPTC